MARALKFRIEVWRDCIIRIAKTNALISCAVTVQLICVFVFAYAKKMFCQGAAHMVLIVITFPIVTFKPSKNNKKYNYEVKYIHFYKCKLFFFLKKVLNCKVYVFINY